MISRLVAGESRSGVEDGDNGCSVTGVPTREDFEDEAAEVFPEASPTANLALSLSSKVVRPEARGLPVVAAALGPGLAGLWEDNDFLRLVNAASAS